MESLASLRSIYTTHGSFKLQKRWAKLLYQILSFCQDKGRMGAPGVVLHSCAYNQSSALPKDKKKYILLNKSSLEQQKDFRKGERNTLAWGVGFDRKRGISTDSSIWQGPKLCAETSLGSLPTQTTCRIQGWSAWWPGSERVSSEETERSPSTKVQPVRLSEKRPLFPGLAVGKPQTMVMRRQVKVHGSEKKESSFDLFLAGNQN